MKGVQQIKSGTYKEYLGNALFGGFALGLIFFFINLIENDFLTSVGRGFAISFSIVSILFSFGFIHQEWYLRRQKIKLLTYKKYSELTSIGLTLNNDLDYEGFLRNYFVRFMTTEKWNKRKKNETFSSVDLYTNPLDFNRLGELIEIIKKMPEIMNAAWGYGIFSVYFEKEAEQLAQTLMNIITTLQKNNVEPIDIKTWNELYRSELEDSMKDLEDKNSKQIFKRGKLFIKYRKSTGNNG